MEVKVDVLRAFVAFYDQEKTAAEAVLRSFMRDVLSIRALKDIHSATHPARLTRATLKPDDPLATAADLLDALDAEAQAESESEE